MPYPATTVKSLKLYIFEKKRGLLNGNFRLAVVVAAQKRFYCINRCTCMLGKKWRISVILILVPIRAYTSFSDICFYLHVPIETGAIK